MLSTNLDNIKKLKQAQNEDQIKLKAEISQKEKEFENLKVSLASAADNSDS